MIASGYSPPDPDRKAQGAIMSLFILILEYLAPLDAVDRALDAHRDWVAQGYRDGLFLLSGPKTPRTGGAILAHGSDRAELESRIAQDPFVVAGLARYTVHEVAPRAADHRLSFLVES
jgi:uncharacterized protein YciI